MQNISSRHNQLYKYLRKQIATQHDSEKNPLAIFNHLHLFQELIQYWQQQTNLLPIYLLLCENYSNQALSQQIEQIFSQLCPSIILSNELFNELQSSASPAKAILICKVLNNNSIDYHKNSVLLEQIQDPGNLGTILRCCLASGYQQILISPGSALAWSEKVLRSAQGAHFQLNIHCDYLLINFIDNFNGEVFATTTDAKQSLFQITKNLKNTHAWIFGSEGQGISQQLILKTTQQIVIPMQNNCQSLNVATAATLCLYEHLRN